MRVIHILADGSEVQDISKHKIKPEEAPEFYQTVHNINRRLKDVKTGR